MSAASVVDELLGGERSAAALQLAVLTTAVRRRPAASMPAAPLVRDKLDAGG